MKTLAAFSCLLLFVFGLAPIAAKAGGYTCSSQCVVIDADGYQVIYLDPVEVESGLNRKGTFDLLKVTCKQYSVAAGFGNRGLAVTGIWWRADKDISKSASKEDAVAAQEGGSIHAPYRPFSRKFALSHNVGIEKSHAESYSYNDVHGLEVHPDPASSASNCQFDRNINKFDIPYPGTDSLLQGD